MKFWLDAQLPAVIAPWLREQFAVDARHIKDAALEKAADDVIFRTLAEPGAVLMTKDEDFVDYVTRLGPPPQVMWIRSGNITNRAMRQLLIATFNGAKSLLEAGEPVVEVRPPVQ